MFGVSMVVAYMLLCRFADLCKCQWGPGFYEDQGRYLRFCLEQRKTDQEYTGQWLDIDADAVDDDADSSALVINGVRISAASIIRLGYIRSGGVAPVCRRISDAAGRSTLVAPFFPLDHLPARLRGRPCNMI